MTGITKKDFQDLTSAMVEGFRSIDKRFDDIDSRLDNMNNRFDGMDERMDRCEDVQNKHSEMLDHIAGRVDALWVEAGAQTQANRRFEARLHRLEAQLNLPAFNDEMIAA